jgi:hypothetical protein
MDTPPNSRDFHKVSAAVGRFLKGLGRSQSSVIAASARLTEVYGVLGRYAPDTPPNSRDFRKVSWSCREVFKRFWEVKKRADFWL